MNPEFGYYIIDIDKIINSAQRGPDRVISDKQKVAMTKFIFKDILSRKTATQVVYDPDHTNYELNFEEPFVITNDTYVYRSSSSVFSLTKEQCVSRMKNWMSLVKANTTDSLGSRWFYFFPTTTNGYGRSVSVDLTPSGLDVLGKTVVCIKKNSAAYLSNELLLTLNYSYMSTGFSKIALLFQWAL